MAGETGIYKLFYLTRGDVLGSLADNDWKRFLTIERQLLNLYKLLSNGIIDPPDGAPSWELQKVSGDTDCRYVSITAGKGHINYKAASTSAPYQLELVRPAGIQTGQTVEFFVYATEDDTTPYTENTVFKASLQVETDTVKYICLGTVRVTYSSPPSMVITTDGRVNIDLFATINDYVKNHVHTGGKNPPPIDLSKHVRGLLSSDNIGDLDISKVTKGTLPSERIGTISHNDLADIGQMTHPQLESIVASILNQTKGDYSRISDVGLANLIVLVLSLKRQVLSGADEDVLFNVDNRLYNSIYYLPHKWTHQLEARNLPRDKNYATIDRVNRQIVGTGTRFYGSETKVWNTIPLYQESKSLLDGIAIPAISNVEFGTENSNEQYFTISKPLNFTTINTLTSATWKDAVKTWALGNGTNMKLFYRRLYYRMFNSTEVKDWTSLSHLAYGFALQYLDSDNVEQPFPADVYMYFILPESNLTLDGEVNGESVSMKVSAPFKIYDHVTEELLPLTDYQFEDGVVMNGKVVLSDISLLLTQSQRANVLGFGFFYQNFNGIEAPTQSTEVNNVNAETSVTMRLYPISSSYVAGNSDFDIFTDEVRESIGLNLPSIGVEDSYGTIIPPESPVPVSFFGINALYCAQQGLMIFRVGNNFPSTEWQQVVIQLATSSLDNTQEAPFSVSGDSRLLVKTRIANSEGNLNSESQFVTINGNSGQSVFVVPAPNKGSVIDIAIYMYRDPVDMSKAPRVKSVALTFSGPGIANFRTWATREDWGSSPSPFLNKLSYILALPPNDFSGTGVGEITGLQEGLALKNTTDLGSYIFFDSYANGLYKGVVDSSGVQSETQIYTPGALYLSPIQQWKSLNSGFIASRDVAFATNGNAVFADTGNDRVIEVDEDGNLVKALQGNIRLSQKERDFAVLSAIYNPRIKKIYLLFSQNVIIKNSTKIFVVINNEYYQCGTEILPVVLSDPIESVSATIEIQIQDETFNAFLDGIGTATSSNFDVHIQQGAVEWVAPKVFGDGTIDGSGDNSSSGDGSGDNGNGNNNGGGGNGNTMGAASIKMSSDDPLKFFRNLGSGSGASIDGLDNLDAPDEDPTDFPTGTAGQIDKTTLLAYTVNNGVCVVSADKGDIVMCNMIAPTSIQVLDDEGWYFANSAPYSVFRYSKFLSLVSKTSRAESAFVFGKGGSVYQISDEIGTILTALPAPSGGKGELRVSKGTNTFRLFFSEGDVVKALPDITNTGYYVLIDDGGQGSFSQSKIVYVSSNGDYLWSWGSGQGSNSLSRPSNMTVLSNGDVVISE